MCAPVVVSKVSLPLYFLPLTLILTAVVTFELFKIRVHLVATMLLLIATCPHKLKHRVLDHRESYTGTRETLASEFLCGGGGDKVHSNTILLLHVAIFCVLHMKRMLAVSVGNRRQTITVS